MVTVEESNTFGIELEFTEGMQFDKGYISPYFVTDQDRMEAVLEDPYILIANQKIGSVHDLLAGARAGHAVGQAAADHRRGRRGRGARDARRQQAPRHLHERGRQGPGLRRPPQGACSRTSPSSPAARSSPRRSGLKLENTDARRCSAAPARVVVDKDNTTIVEGAGAEADVKGRIDQIKREIEDTDSDFDREKLQERLAKLAGGVAVIKVGAATEVEMKEKKHRIEDALSATRAAIEEGIVAGRRRGAAPQPAAVDKLAHDTQGDEETGAMHRAPRARGAAALDRA